jgi:hypothetical protein
VFLYLVYYFHFSQGEGASQGAMKARFKRVRYIITRQSLVQTIKSDCSLSTS